MLSWHLDIQLCTGTAIHRPDSYTFWLQWNGLTMQKATYGANICKQKQGHPLVRKAVAAVQLLLFSNAVLISRHAELPNANTVIT